MCSYMFGSILAMSKDDVIFSVVLSVVNDVTITPIANDEADTIAIAASLFILPFSANLSKKKAAIKQLVLKT